MNKGTDAQALICTTLYFIFIFTASLYDGKYACFHMGVMRLICRHIHGIARQIGAYN